MFVRWKKRPLSRGDFDLCAVVVASERIDGKPRQRYIKYLAGISISSIDDRYSVWRFWEKVDHKLNSIASLDAEKRQYLRGQVALRVPVLSEAETQESFDYHCRMGFSSPI
jgi:hypothetical protein